MDNTIDAALDAEHAKAWLPSEVDKIVGVVTDVTERDGPYGTYPIVTLRTEDGERAIHAYHDVLAGELARIAPKPGDEVGVKYLGMHPERGYHRYKVRRAGATAEVSWSKYGDGAQQPEQAEPSVNAPLIKSDNSSF